MATRTLMVQPGASNPYCVESVKGKKIVLYSGGLDSFCMAHHVKPDLLLYFDTGLSEQIMERRRIVNLIDAHGLPAPILFDDRFNLARYKLPNETMPFRNLFFIAAAFTYGDKIYLGKTASSRHLDKNATFANKALNVLKYVSQIPNDNPPGLIANDMEIVLPFDNKTKSKFLSEYLCSDGSIEHLMMTRSCYRAEGLECGRCISCVRKAIAFINNGLPIDFFNQDPVPLFHTQLDGSSPMVMDEIQSAMEIARTLVP